MESQHVGGQSPELGPEAARAALEEIDTTRQDFAARAASPRGYYTVLGVAFALLCLTLSSEGRWWAAITLVAALLLLVGDMVWYTRHTGVAAMASLREPGAWVAWVMIVVSLACVALSAAFREVWVGLAAGLVALVVTSVLGPIWDRAWVRSLRESR